MRNGESWYDTAEICLNGHESTPYAFSSPEQRQKYCDKCGEKTITNCPSCNAIIRGYYHVPGVISFSQYKTPSYCHNCGNPYPWTAEKLNAAKELADLIDELSPEEQEQLKMSLDDLVKEGPRTVVAQTRFKRILSKTGPEIATGFKDILVDVVSETVKKAIWGNS